MSLVQDIRCVLSSIQIQMNQREELIHKKLFCNGIKLPDGVNIEDFGYTLDNIDYGELKESIRIMHSHYKIRKKNEESETEKQKSWQLPPLVEPDILITNDADNDNSVINDGVSVIQSNAELFRVKEKNLCDGSINTHSILKLFSQVPDSMKGVTDQARNREQNTFNLFMGDVSGSMNSFWPEVVVGWNTHIKPRLVGRTTIMTFGSDVTTKRSGSTADCYEVTQGDFDGSSTNLTGALQKIVEKIYACKEAFINVFFITDGGHNQTQCSPIDVINKMIAPIGKVCDVYVLGAGDGFPVAISFNLRSRLHNGNANLPTIFWAKKENNNDMEQQMQDIAGYLSQTENFTSGIRLNMPGKILPYMPPADTFHMNEYVYFDEPPERLKKNLRIKIGNRSGLLDLETKNPNLDLFSHIFRQWNGILLQIYNKGEEIPSEILPFMKRLATTAINELKDKSKNSIRSRIDSKMTYKTYENNFNELFNKIKNLLTIDYYKNDILLANDILATTVSKDYHKYTEKSLRLKGHTNDQYVEDIRAFKQIIEEEMANISKIDIAPDDCCNVTLTSTVSDLQDEDLNELMDLDKFEFLKKFTMSGIPVFTTIKGSVEINPWILGIRRILKSPYTIISQTVLESMSEAKPGSLDPLSYGVKLQEDENEDASLFNAVIPVFPPQVAKHMNKIARTNIYAMCCTFAIIKNPHIIDFNVHMASLGVLWVRILYENPNIPRPEYVEYRINCIMATAFLYFDRPSFAKYRQHLLVNTNQALMTEANEVELKCESIIKPMFILKLAVMRNHITNNNLIKQIVKTILIEYVGRCLSHSIKNKTIKYKDYFIINNTHRMHNTDDDDDNIVKEARMILSGGSNTGSLLSHYYHEEELKKAAKNVLKPLVQQHFCDIVMDIQIILNKKKIEEIWNVSACGDVSLSTLKVFAKEVGLSDFDVEELFNYENLFTYIVHAFNYTESRNRLVRELPTYNECYEELRKKLLDEKISHIVEDTCKQLTSKILNMWHSAYEECHSEIIIPMTESTIIKRAKKEGVNVNEGTFKEIYKKYESEFGLLRNACQSTKCPWFLQPNRSYNEHAYAGRKSNDFIHCLHRITKQQCLEDLRSIKNSIKNKQDYNKGADRFKIEEKLDKLDLLPLKINYMHM